MYEQFDEDQIEALTGDFETGIENVSSDEFGQLALMYASCDNQE
jgi:hypothetical protein